MIVEEKSQGIAIFQRIDEILADCSTTQKEYVWSQLLKAGKGATDPSEKVSLTDLQKELSNFNVQQEFDKFFRDRAKQKNNLYFYVVFTGICTAVIASIMLLFAGFFNFSFSAALSNPHGYAILFILLTFCRISGICLYSTVPVDDYDLFRALLRPENSHFKVVLCIFLFAYMVDQIYTITIALGSFLSLCYTPIALGAIYSIRPNVSYDVLVLVTNMCIISIDINLSFYCSYAEACSVPGNFPRSALDFQSAIFGAVSFMQCAYVLFGICQRQEWFNTIGWRLPKWIDSSRCKNWGAFELSVIFYSTFGAFCISYLFNGIFVAAARPWSSLIPSCSITKWDNLAATTYITGAFCDVFPIVILIYLTPQKCFTLMARRFEGRVSQRQKDGALMSALIESCRDLSNKRAWLKRRVTLNTDRVELERGDNVERFYWIEGSLETIGNIERITVDYHYDIDHYKISLQEQRPSFQQWAEENFDIKDSNITKDDELQRVVVERNITTKSKRAEDLNRREKELLEWSVENLRAYQWKGAEEFQEQFLKQSPREMKPDEKEGTYNKSEKFEVNDKHKIDFFVSHSWSDDSTWKRNTLIKFSEEFKVKHGKYPTFWFDKLCINQACPGEGINTLPINVGACDAMLVLLGETYIKRLWCVWELFTIFTFTNKELAMERIVLISQTNRLEEQLQDFKIDDAHSFDPNEEVKLLHLMKDVIGSENFEHSLKSMNLGVRSKVPTSQYICGFMRGKVSSSEKETAIRDNKLIQKFSANSDFYSTATNPQHSSNSNFNEDLNL